MILKARRMRTLVSMLKAWKVRCRCVVEGSCQCRVEDGGRVETESVWWICSFFPLEETEPAFIHAVRGPLMLSRSHAPGSWSAVFR